MAKLIFKPNPFEKDETVFFSNKETLKEILQDFYEFTNSKLVFLRSSVSCYINNTCIKNPSPDLKIGYLDEIKLITTIHDPIFTPAALISAVTTSLISMAISFVLNGIISLLMPKSEDTNKPSQKQDSQSYSWSGPQSIADQGVPIQLPYGIVRAAPNIINSFIEGSVVFKKKFTNDFTLSSESVVGDIQYFTVSSTVTDGIQGISLKLAAGNYNGSKGQPPSSSIIYDFYYKLTTDSVWTGPVTYRPTKQKNQLMLKGLGGGASYDFKLEKMQGNVGTPDKNYSHIKIQKIVNDTTDINTSDESYLNLMCSFGKGEIYGIEDIYINDQDYSTFINPESDLVEIEFDKRYGTNDQTCIEWFTSGGSYVSGAFPYNLAKDPDTNDGYYQIISCKEYDDTIAFCIGFNCLLFTSSDGGIGKNGVEITIEISETEQGPWTLLGEYKLEGKNTNTINRFIYIEGITPGSYYLKISRGDTDYPGSLHKSDVNINSLTCYNGIGYVYPGLGLLGLRLGASEKISGSVPNISARIYGRKVTVPYLRVSREYGGGVPGIDVEFGNCYYDAYDEVYRYFGGPLPKEEVLYDSILELTVVDNVIQTTEQWTDNPPWIYYDLLTSPDCLGHKIKPTQVVWSEIYSASLWSDELVEKEVYFTRTDTTFTSTSVTIGALISFEWYEDVNLFVRIDNGDYAGQKRRVTSITTSTSSVLNFDIGWSDTPASGTTITVLSMDKRNRCNIVLEENSKAIDVLYKLMNSFRLTPIWMGNSYTLIIEKDKPISDIVTMGNLIQNKGYSEQIKFTKPSHYSTQYYDEDEDFKRMPAEIEDDDFVSGKKEERVTVDLIGITEDWRIDKQLEFVKNKGRLNRTLNYEAQIDQIRCLPGDVIAVAHDGPAWGTASGRIMGKGTTFVEIDKVVLIESGTSYSILIRNGSTYGEYIVDTSTTLGSETSIYTSKIYVTVSLPIDIIAYDSVYTFGTTILYKSWIVEQITRTSEHLVKVSLSEYSESLYNEDTLSDNEYPTNHGYGVFYPLVDADDGNWSVGGNAFSIGNPLGIGKSAYDSNAFIRFTNVNIPNGATIVSAFVRITAYQTMSAELSLNIYLVNEDNASAPIDVTSAEAKSLTTNVVWDVIDEWTDGSEQDTVDLTPIVQSIVNRSGWSSGNAMIVYIKDDTTTLGNIRYFYDLSYSSGVNKAELHIEWEV